MTVQSLKPGSLFAFLITFWRILYEKRLREIRGGFDESQPDIPGEE